jgi:tetratricopeptide (TPR) repeat protein
MIIGRSEELGELRDALEALAFGGSRRSVLFVTGEAGIGKSTLLAALREELAASSMAPAVASVACSTPVAGREIGGVEALEPWALALAQLVAGPAPARGAGRIVGELALAWVRVIPVVGDVLESAIDTARIVRRHASERAETEPQSAGQGQLFQQCINVLGELARERPVVIIIDDAHWADPSSINLLFAAARQLEGRPVGFVVAYRPDDVAAGAGSATHPVAHVRGELERYGLAAEIGVPRFGPDELDALLRSRYRSYRNDDDFERWLARVGAGNALFITQFLASLEEDGRIDPATGEIRDGYESAPIPTSAVAVIRGRIGRVPEDTRELLRYASVEGDTFTSTVLARVAELPALKLLQRLRLVEESHALVRSLGRTRVYVREEQAWQFSHVLVQRVLYDGLDDEERRLIHRIVLDALREGWDEARAAAQNVPGIAMRIATHASVVGEPELAAEVLLEGARVSWERFAEREALRLLDEMESAVEAIGESGRLVVALRADGALLRGSIAFHHGRVYEAVDRYQAARLLADEASDARRAIDAINGLARSRFWLGEYPVALAAAQEAVEEASRAGHAAGEATAATIAGSCVAELGAVDEALAWYDRALAAARSVAADSFEEAAALNSIGKLQRRFGTLDEAARTFAEALAMSRRNGDRTTEANVLNNLGSLETSRGNDADGLRYLEEGFAVCRASGNDWTGAYIDANIGVHFDMASEHARALEHYRRALEVVRRYDDVGLQARLHGNIGNVLFFLGDRTGSLESYRASLELNEAIGSHEGIADTCASLADLHVELGMLDRARELAERSLSMAQRSRRRETEGWAWRALAMIERRLADASSGDERRAHLELAVAHAERCTEAFVEVETRQLGTWLSTAQALRDELAAATPHDRVIE